MISLAPRRRIKEAKSSPRTSGEMTLWRTGPQPPEWPGFGEQGCKPHPFAVSSVNHNHIQV